MAREVIEIFLRWERQEIRTEFWLGNRLEDREDDGRITLRWILGRWVARMRCGCKRLRIVSNGRIY